MDFSASGTIVSAPRERAYVYALGTLGADPHRPGDIASAMDTTSDKVAVVRNSLIAKGMIFGPEYVETEITVPLPTSSPSDVRGRQRTNGPCEIESEERSFVPWPIRERPFHE